MGGSVPAIVLLAALAIDLLWGELPAAAHPVVWMGKIIAWAERRMPRRAGGQLLAGLGLALGLPAACYGVAEALLAALRPVPWLSWAASVYLLTASFAVSELRGAALRVGRCLAGGDLQGARCGLRALCSRDPETLREPELIAATVESVAENASDSIVAPLLYFALFGVPGALAYRAVNTLDAMLGYRDHRERYGKAGARLDDAANWLPARLTAALLLAAGAALRARPREGLRTLLRDGGKTASPNAGRPMAAMAGLLGVELRKADHYVLGQPARALEVARIREACRLVGFCAALAYGLATAWLLYAA